MTVNKQTHESVNASYRLTDIENVLKQLSLRRLMYANS